MQKASIAMATALASATPVWAAEAVPEFLDLVRLIPASERTWSAWRVFSYVDFRAVEGAAGLPHPDSEIDLGDGATEIFAHWPTDRRDAWLTNLRRVTAGPRDLMLYAQVMGTTDEAMAYTTGLDFFAVDRAIEFWDDPGVQVLAGVGPIADPQDLRYESDLGVRGFALTDLGGVPVWHRFADNTVTFMLTDEGAPSDPFDADMMRSVRLAFLPDVTIATAQWPDLEAVLERYRASEPATDVAMLMEAMVSAALTLEGVDRRVVQATAMPMVELAFAPGPIELMVEEMLQPGGSMPDSAELQQMADAAAPEGPALPLYPLALFLDLQAGDDQVAAIALPYPDLPTAATAADALAQRLSLWVPDGAAEPFLSRTAIETVAVDAPGIGSAIVGAFFGQVDASEADKVAQAMQDAGGLGGAVAVAGVRYPMPSGADAALPGEVWYAWQESILRRDFSPLAIQ